MDKRNRGMIVALIGIFIVFTALVPVYWIASNGYPDGLDALLDQQNVQGKESAYSPPLAALKDYGVTMPLYVLSGVVGAVIVLSVLLLVGRIIKHSRREDGP